MSKKPKELIRKPPDLSEFRRLTQPASPMSTVGSIDAIAQELKHLRSEVSNLKSTLALVSMDSAPMRKAGIENGDFARLLNQTKSFEGGGILPQPGGGEKRLPSISGFQLLSNESVLGGARLTLGWNDEQLAVQDKIQLQVWASQDWNVITTSYDPTDISYANLVQYQAPVVCTTSPGYVFVPAVRRMLVVITAGTVHSSGVISRVQFQSSVAAVVQPVNSFMERKTANFTVDNVYQRTYLVNTSGGNITATLPSVSTVNEGFEVAIKKITADANTITIQPAGSDVIDNLASIVTAVPDICYVFRAERANSKWWIV